MLGSCMLRGSQLILIETGTGQCSLLCTRTPVQWEQSHVFSNMSTKHSAPSKVYLTCTMTFLLMHLQVATVVVQVKSQRLLVMASLSRTSTPQ